MTPKAVLQKLPCLTSTPKLGWDPDSRCGLSMWAERRVRARGRVRILPEPKRVGVSRTPHKPRGGGVTSPTGALRGKKNE